MKIPGMEDFNKSRDTFGLWAEPLDDCQTYHKCTQCGASIAVVPTRFCGECGAAMINWVAAKAEYDERMKSLAGKGKNGGAENA